MSETKSELEPLFAPQSVAVVGASPDSTYASSLIDNLLDYGYDEELYFVNPNREVAWGDTCYNTLSDIPATIDLAVISVPRQFVVETVEEAGEINIPTAIVISAGFSEADERGRELEAKLGEIAEKHGIRVCGPNCIGLANMHDDTVLTSTCTRKPDPGSIGLISQSGALAFTTFYERARDEDIDFAYIVSTGNEVDLTVTDYINFMAADSRVEVICTYIEGVEDPKRFMQAAEKAVRNGTPVLTVKIGQSETAEKATLSHTGSLTGSEEAWNAAFRQSGVERVEDIPDLISRAAAHANFEPPTSNKTCITSTSGGLASLLADMADVRGLELPPIDGETEQTLLEMEELLTFGEINNPADIRGYGASIFSEIGIHLGADEQFDAYVFAFGLSGVDERADSVVDDIIRVKNELDEPIIILWTGRKEPAELSDPQPLERLRNHLPVYYDPAAAMDALSSLANQRRRSNRLNDRYDSSEKSSVDIIDDTGDFNLVENDRDVLSWERSSDLLESHGIDVVDSTVITDVDQAVEAFYKYDRTVVFKVDSPDIPHRTDVGAVITGIDTADAAREAYHRLMQNVNEHEPEARINGIIVQPQIDNGVEVLVGISQDEVFGSIVTVGSGGTLVEIMDDSSQLIPPFTQKEIQIALGETNIPSLLTQRREGTSLDDTHLVKTLLRIGHLAENHTLELDLNPVIVNENGIQVIDILIKQI